MKELLTLEQAAERLGVHVTTVRGWVREGKVPAYRLGQRFARVDWEEVLLALSAQRAASRGHQNVPSEASAE